jgi:hypothetical protein
VAGLQVLHRALHRGGVHLHHTVKFTSGQILSPADWGDIVDSGIELSYRHTRLTDIEENKIQMGSKLYEENFLSFFIIAHIGWQAGTITLCQRSTVSPRQGLRNFPQAGSNLLSDEKLSVFRWCKDIVQNCLSRLLNKSDCAGYFFNSFRYNKILTYATIQKTPTLLYSQLKAVHILRRAEGEILASQTLIHSL